MRQDALKQLKDILLQNPLKSLDSQLNSLLYGIALFLDKEKEIRTNSFHLGCDRVATTNALKHLINQSEEKILLTD